MEVKSLIMMNQEERRKYRAILYDITPTEISKLEQIEAKFARSPIITAQMLIDWIQKNKFQILLLTGDLKHADIQLFRRKERSRYHWRLYMFSDRLIVECHIDKIDPGRRLSSLQESNDWQKDIIDHLLLDVVLKPNHHYIKKDMIFNNKIINFIINELKSERFSTKM